MDYLKARFHEELSHETNLYVDANGQVCIRERRWEPEDILRAISEEIYTDVFKEWLGDRRQDLLGRADAIIQKFDQADRFAALKATYERGAIIPLVGAGLSQPSGYPGWKSFLLRLRRQTTIPEDQIIQQLSRGEFEEVAQKLADALGVGFNEEMENTFGCNRELAGPVQLLPYLFATAVITTNFDSVLKRSYENASRAFSDTIPGHEAQELPRYIGANQRVLVKVHGRAITGVGRVLTTQEYNEAYKGNLPNIVATLCSRTLLFLGCSLDVDRLLAEIRRFVEARGHDNVSRHYAFLSSPDTEEGRLSRKAELAQHNIYPIWYPTDEHDDSIEALMYRLADGVIDL